MGSVLFALFAFAAFSLVGCSQGAKWATFKVSDGTAVRWSPAVPAIGDLMRVEATVPGTSAGLPADKSGGSPSKLANGSSSASTTANDDPSNDSSSSGISVPSVKSPSSKMIASVSVEYLPNGTRYVWSFRVTRAGDWSFVSGDTTEKLWTTATVAGNATELKKLDASGLWKGTLKKAPPAQPVSNGVSPAAGNLSAPGTPVAPGQPASPVQSAPQRTAPASPASPGNALPVPAPKAVTL